MAHALALQNQSVPVCSRATIGRQVLAHLERGIIPWLHADWLEEHRQSAVDASRKPVGDVDEALQDLFAATGIDHGRRVADRRGGVAGNHGGPHRRGRSDFDCIAFNWDNIFRNCGAACCTAQVPGLSGILSPKLQRPALSGPALFFLTERVVSEFSPRT